MESLQRAIRSYEWVRYTFAISMVVMAAALRVWPLQSLGSTLTWVTFTPAITVAAMYGGLNAGLFATALSCLTIVFLWPILVVAPFIKNPADFLGMIVFLLTGGMISGVAGAMRRAQDREHVLNESLSLQADSEKHFQAILQTMMDGLVHIDQKGVILATNHAITKMFGYEEHELIGKNVSMLMPEPHHSAHDGYLLNRHSSETSPLIGRRVELPALHRNGNTFSIDLSVNELFDKNGTSYIGVLRDVSDAKKIHRELQESEQRSKAILQTMMDGLLQIDQKGIILATNDAICKMFGYEEAELVGKNINILMPEPHQSAHDGYLLNRRNSETSTVIGRRLELPALHRNGTIFSIDVSVNELAEENRISYIGVLRDITETKRIQNELQKIYEKNIAILRNASDGIHILDIQGYVIDASDAFCNMLGYSRDEIIGMNVSAWDTQFSPEEVKEVIKKEFTQAEQTIFETRHRRKDGSEFDVEISGHAIDLEGRPVLFNSSRDITVRKQLHDELVHARTVAESANTAKSEFLANMSHEIRTPISAIIGFSSLAQRMDLPPKADSYFKKINTAASSLLGIVNDVLDFSKIEAGKLDMEDISFSLDEVFENITSLFGNKARSKGIELSFGSTAGVPVSLSGDPLRLTQVLTNLLSNAIKFTERGEITLLVELIKNEDDYVELQFGVKDTGIGMTPEQQASIFKPFAQADNSITRKYGGTGLGLVICQQLVGLMGGKIFAESKAGEGTHVCFTALFGVVSDKVTSLPNFAGKRVIVVDDSPVMRKLVMAQLRKLNCSPAEVDSSTTLISILQSGDTADCIVMDWHMPDLDGVEAARKLSAMGINVPIILMTGDDPELARAEAGNLVMEIVAKPISTSKLNECLVTLFGGIAVVKETNHQSVIIPDLSGHRILLVDDNEFNREVGTEFVSLTKAVVVTANDGQQAVDAVLKGDGDSSERFDLILMDIQMPVMDGYAAAELIRAKCPQLPIVAITADVTPKGRDRMVEAGMNYILSKPIDDSKLYRLLTKLLRPQATVSTEVVQTSVGISTSSMIAEHVDDWLNLPGFDSKSALDRMSGNETMYRKFLLLFRDRNAFSPKAFHEALKQTDLSDARRMIHTLKGTAGSVGAVKLSVAAENLQLEIDAATPSAQPVSPESIQKLETEWERAMVSLSKLNS
jgi:PAS domain S-box-containing protein